MPTRGARFARADAGRPGGKAAGVVAMAGVPFAACGVRCAVFGAGGRGRAVGLRGEEGRWRVGAVRPFPDGLRVGVVVRGQSCWRRRVPTTRHTGKTKNACKRRFQKQPKISVPTTPSQAWGSTWVLVGSRGFQCVHVLGMRGWLRGSTCGYGWVHVRAHPRGLEPPHTTRVSYLVPEIAPRNTRAPRPPYRLPIVFRSPSDRLPIAGGSRSIAPCDPTGRSRRVDVANKAPPASSRLGGAERCLVDVVMFFSVPPPPPPPLANAQHEKAPRPRRRDAAAVLAIAAPSRGASVIAEQVGFIW